MSSGTLHIVDSRTNINYQLPIRHNAIAATDFKQIKGPSTDTTRGGLRVHDPGLQNTSVVQTDISFLDPTRDQMLYRGYDLEQLHNGDYEDVLHLLVWGSYPTASERQRLSRALAEQMQAVPESVRRTIQSFPRTTYPLPLLISGLSAYLACVPESITTCTDAKLYQGNVQNVDTAIIRTVAGYAVVLGLVASHRKGVEFQAPSLNKTYTQNLLTMTGILNDSRQSLNTAEAAFFRQCTVYSADHGMALSAFSALVTASSLTDPISCLISSTAASYGPLHLGASEVAHRMMEEIGSPDRVPAFIEDVKNGRTKLFGYGHRVTKTVDERIRLMQPFFHDLGIVLDPLFNVAQRVEEVASQDEYFIKRQLYPNADLYIHFLLIEFGFEPEMVTPVILGLRTIGMMAHWREYMLTRGKIMRPSHIYTGNATGEKHSSNL